ncbi:transcription-repair coupling factor [Bacillaceae bacterium S4-13-56]
MESLKKFMKQQRDLTSVFSGIESGLQEQLVSGLSGSARNTFIKVLEEATNRPILLITHQLMHAQKIYDDLVEMSKEKERPPVFLYPVNELISSEIAVASPELKSERIATLMDWTQRESGILIAPIAALKRFLPPKEYWNTHRLIFQVGQIVNLDEQLKLLIEMGYHRVDMVNTPGEFALRGGILDIYSITNEHPVRIEFFDDEVDSIRHFNPESQRSLQQEKEIIIGPATELLLTEEDYTRAKDRLEDALAHTLKKTQNKEQKERLTENIEYDLDRLGQAERFQEMHKYISLFYENPSSLLDYLPKNGVIVFDETNRIQETAQQLDKEEAEWHGSLLEAGQIVRDINISYDWLETWGKMNRQRVYMSVFLRHIANTQPQNIVNVSCRAMQQFHGQMNVLQNEMKRWEKGGFSVLFLAPNEERAEKIQSVLEDYGMKVHITNGEPTFPLKTPTIQIGRLESGYELPMHKLAVITEQELFKKQSQRKVRKKKISNAERIKSYQELKVGDYVVHTDHGIGRYVGIETLEIKGNHKDYMLIKYSGNDKLYVPIDQIDLVQKYVGSEGKEPKLYKLGGSEWKKVKRKVQSSVEDIADDLIKLYAEREASRGYAFSKDTEMQREFEASFPYQETEDQIRCIEEIKRDMERIRPMDRLLCGDVGYGKTEVAIRAAFKAVADGKQVAILVPTTILAQQHYQTIRERFQNFAVNIGVLSRFQTKKRQKETTDLLKKGLVDIVVGTHRLLSKDVVFRDLGLLIVDEEQRFGVKHKEKIKQLKTNVDVLTLTATPIPRTLHMSMLGVRDLSVIETPPENRFPIQTYVMEYNHMLIREAIERELSRGGQVFFLYNRVENIDRMSQEISSLVEEARVQYAHGQMNENELENVMVSFLEGEFDVLVSTTIIETGVDIPNVNTLIVYDADKMGLSQLYQLRGRVGRSNRVAFAYFTYQKDKVLTEVAEKRLEAIKEFTELGSGFKIAMRDLSIRGAGNLLGAQQHGFIDSVGFDMYSQMLSEAIEARKEGKLPQEVKAVDVELTLDVDAYIPDTYIQDERQKIDMYKRIRAIEDEQDIQDIRDELMDRFGDYPEEVENLLTIAKLKMKAKKERIQSISENQKKIELLMDEKGSQEIDGSKLFALASTYGRKVQLGTDGNLLKVEFKWDKESFPQRYEQACDFIEKLSEVKRDLAQ